MLNRTDPQLIRTCAELQRWSDEARASGRRIALVPTMGALHEGHLSLVQAGHRLADRVVVSIFVNPTQFGPAEDFARYPRDLARDVESLRKVGTDVVFTPSVEEIYPSGDATWVTVERLTSGLCGSSRPGMSMWREHVFAWMSRSATSAMDFFNIPPNRVVELGTQIEI